MQLKNIEVDKVCEFWDVNAIPVTYRNSCHMSSVILGMAPVNMSFFFAYFTEFTVCQTYNLTIKLCFHY